MSLNFFGSSSTTDELSQNEVGTRLFNIRESAIGSESILSILPDDNVVVNNCTNFGKSLLNVSSLNGLVGLINTADTKVEVIDSGTGEINFTLDNALKLKVMNAYTQVLNELISLNIVPDATHTRDIGSTTKYYNNVYGKTMVCKNGNGDNVFTENQILLNWKAAPPALGDNYSHAIKTRHKETVNASNAIDFYLWQTGQGINDVGNKQVMSITGSGVGINTTTPSAPLHILTSVTAQASFAKSGSTTNKGCFSEWKDNEELGRFIIGCDGTGLKAIDQGAGIVGTWTAKPLLFLTNTNEAMRITSSGNVGIGDSSPNALLHLEKQYDNNSTLWEASNLRFNARSGATPWGLGEITGYIKAGPNNSSSSFPGGLLFKTKPANSNSDEALITRMCIDANGNVGIATSSPSTTLDVNGTTTVRGTLQDAYATPFKKDTSIIESNKTIQNVKLSSTAILRSSVASFRQVCMSASGEIQYSVSGTGTEPNLTATQLYSSTDYGITWTTAGSATGATTFVQSMCCSKDGKCVYFHLAAGGTNTLVKSLDYGATTTSSAPILSVTSGAGYWITCSDNGKIVYSTGDSCFGRSFDNGATWTSNTSIAVGGSSISLSGFQMRGICCSGDGRYIVLLKGNTSGTGTVYVSNDYGATWTKPTSIVDNKKYRACGISSTGQFVIVATEENDTSHMISTDYGVSWNLISGAGSISNIVGACCSSDFRHIALVAGSTTRKLYYSSNYGQTFSDQTDASISANYNCISCSSDFRYLSYVLNNAISARNNSVILPSLDITGSILFPSDNTYSVATSTNALSAVYAHTGSFKNITVHSATGADIATSVKPFATIYGTNIYGSTKIGVGTTSAKMPLHINTGSATSVYSAGTQNGVLITAATYPSLVLENTGGMNGYKNLAIQNQDSCLHIGFQSDDGSGWTKQTQYKFDIYSENFWCKSNILPPSGSYNLGTAMNNWNQGHFNVVYTSSGTVSVSDRNKKKDIVDLDNALDTVMKLKPVSYKFIEGTSGRTHTGFIAQDCQNLVCDNWAGFVKHEDNYGLRYEEFIAINSRAIQELNQRLVKLEKRDSVREAKVVGNSVIDTSPLTEDWDPSRRDLVQIYERLDHLENQPASKPQLHRCVEISRINELYDRVSALELRSPPTGTLESNEVKGSSVSEDFELVHSLMEKVNQLEVRNNELEQKINSMPKVESKSNEILESDGGINMMELLQQKNFELEQRLIKMEKSNKKLVSAVNKLLRTTTVE